VSHDPTIETLGVQLSPNTTKRYGSREYGTDIQLGVQTGCDEARREGVRLCCASLLVLGINEDAIDTSPHVVQTRLAEFVRSHVVKWSEPIPPLRAEWLTADVVALARGIHANAALDGLPALTDALIEAGCDDPLVLEHLKTCSDYAPSCWVVEMILDQSSTPK
jgi:hypothetical protein